jgi:hypothetical protein
LREKTVFVPHALFAAGHDVRRNAGRNGSDVPATDRGQTSARMSPLSTCLPALAVPTASGITANAAGRYAFFIAFKPGGAR